MTTERYQTVNKSDEAYGQTFGEQCTVGRVGSSAITTPADFTVINQIPNTVYTYKYAMTPISKEFVNQKADAEYYVIKGRRSVLQSGDILKPTLVTSTNSTTPQVTFVNINPMGIAIGFKTTRLGAIYNGTTKIFDNIYFEYSAGSGYPGSALDTEVMSQLGVPAMQAVMFNRQWWTTTQDAEGLFLYQIDTTPNLIWEVQSVFEFGNITQMYLKRKAVR